MKGATKVAVAKEQDTALRLMFIFDTNDFFPPYIGGMGKHANELSHELASRGHELIVMSRQREPGPAAPKRVGNLMVKLIPPRGVLKGKGWKAVGPLILFFARVFHFGVTYRNRYDIVMVSGFRMLSIPVLAASLITGKKCLIRLEVSSELTEDFSPKSLHDMHLPASKFLVKTWRGLRNAFLRKADGFIAISVEIRDGLTNMGFDPDKVHLLPNGIDTKRFAPVPVGEKYSLRQELSLPQDKTIINFTGRLALCKGVLLLIQVWQDLVQKYSDIHLVMIGSGDDSVDNCEEELKRYIADNNLQSTVTLTGSVENVYEYFQASDLFVFPSEYEGFALTLIEGMSCELPTIATTVAGATEFIQHRGNGYLIPPKDYEELRNAIEWMLDHKDMWVTMGASARRTIEKRYRMSVVAERFADMCLALTHPETDRILIE